MSGAQFSADVSVAHQDIDAVIRSGLGPIYYKLLGPGGRVSQIDPQMRLKAADLTSRAISAEQFANVESIIARLHSRGIKPTLLKGAAFASRYYPEPHMRIMGDIDLLVAPDSIDEAQDTLVSDGFQKQKAAPGMDYETHIHSAPLYHPERKIWIELHRSLLPKVFAASHEVPLDLSGIDDEVESMRFGSLDVKCFRTEFELVYLSAGWCFDLTHGFGNAGLQRSLFDCTLMLKQGEGGLDWDRIMNWSRGTLTGATLYILLSFLKRIGVFADQANHCEELRKQQNYVNRVSLRLMHDRIEKYLVHFDNYGGLASPNTTASMFDALIRKNPAWQNILAVPGNILFPRREPRRFKLHYQLGRLQNALGRKK